MANLEQFSDRHWQPQFRAFSRSLRLSEAKVEIEALVASVSLRYSLEYNWNQHYTYTTCLIIIFVWYFEDNWSTQD